MQRTQQVIMLNMYMFKLRKFKIVSVFANFEDKFKLQTTQLRTHPVIQDKLSKSILNNSKSTKRQNRYTFLNFIAQKCKLKKKLVSYSREIVDQNNSDRLNFWKELRHVIRHFYYQSILISKMQFLKSYRYLPAIHKLHLAHPA